ncbi:hypothetical protein [Halomicrococcus sp. SG-WS-1]|uniref:hypothetical protein n=1 Tax=Halomicrococcus sp. SG-WS-1 TaxID=3439057 RepID=UPI003F798C0C
MLNRIVATFVGALLAGTVAAAAETAGAPGGYAVVVGLGVAMPLLVFAGWKPQFDVDAYREARWPEGAARDAAVVAVASAAFGAVVVAVAERALSASAAVGVGAGGVFAGGYAVAYYLARRFRAGE